MVEVFPMFGRSHTCLLAGWWILLGPVLLLAQQARPDSQFDLQSGLERILPGLAPRPVPPSNVVGRFPIRAPGGYGFPEMARAAGIIFSGTVTGVRRGAARPGQALETVVITFQVENAIRGATAGESLTISQWIGVWSAGQRYRVGERVLLFLYAPSKLGLTSSVGGPMGRFHLDAEGRIRLSAYHLSAFRSNPVLGGKSRAGFGDFALAVRQACEEE